MTWKIKINIPAMDRAADALKKIGTAFDLVGGAAKSVADATDNPRLRSASRSLRWAGDAAWASLMRRIFGCDHR